MNFHQKRNFLENLTSGCHGKAVVGVKSTTLAQITLLVSMEVWSHDNSDKIQQTLKGNLLATSYRKKL